jgi:hypothetical protein
MFRQQFMSFEKKTLLHRVRRALSLCALLTIYRADPEVHLIIENVVGDGSAAVATGVVADGWSYAGKSKKNVKFAHLYTAVKLILSLGRRKLVFLVLYVLVRTF